MEYLKCPSDEKCDAFNLRPLTKPTEDKWFAAPPLGRYKLATVVPTLCKEGGLHGYKTNHSLTTSAAARLYRAGVDEQLITEVTGHRQKLQNDHRRHRRSKKENQ